MEMNETVNKDRIFDVQACRKASGAFKKFGITLQDKK